MDGSLMCESNPDFPQVTVSNLEFFPNSSDVIIHSELNEVPLSEGIVLSQTSQESASIVIRAFQKEKYCRICGSENEAVNLEGIFGERGIQIELQRKIYTHLNLQVERDDSLPQQVCSTCIYHLNICHHLLQVCQAADSKLRQLFLLSQDEEEPITPKNNNEYNTNEDCALFNDSGEMLPLDSERDEVKKVTKKEASSASLLCHVCGKHFKHPRNLQAHKQTHLGDLDKKKYRCSLCTSSFRSSFHLSEHMNTHYNATPYKCDKCGKLFNKRSQLRQHLVTHSGVKFPCAKCKLQFTRKSNLLAHMKIHKENRMFECKLCEAKFPSLNALLSHRKNHSQDDIKNRLDNGMLADQDGVFKCSVCEKLMTNRTSLKSHMRQHTVSSVERLECELCGKAMRSRGSLEYHRRSQHSTERPHNCTDCGQGFMTKPLLDAHQTTHTGEKPFRCEICFSGFRSRNNLQQHMSKHKNEKKYHCDLCDKKFKGRTALINHKKSHTGDKPFICDICGRSFFQKFCLTKHQRVHSRPEKEIKPQVVEIVFSCDLCSETFNCLDALTKHREDTHNNGLTVIPLNVTNNLFETHIVTDDGQNISVSWEPMLTS